MKRLLFWATQLADCSATDSLPRKTCHPSSHSRCCYWDGNKI